MRFSFAPWARLSLLGAVAAACPLFASAQAFTADYDLVRMAAPDAGALNLGAIRFGTNWQASNDFSGMGLSMQAGRNWFAQVGAGHNLTHVVGVPGASTGVVNVGGGYRWSDGQALSLQISRGRGPDQRLGLAVNYDWPRYFVRFSYDAGLGLQLPQDNLRFSAGMRF